MSEYEIETAIIIFVFGLVIGSFLNVCIHRIPNDGLSIHFPHRSLCPNCQSPVLFYDNIPIISFLLLKGKCRSCHIRISIIYPVVELTTAVIFLFLFYHFGLTLELIQGALLVSLFIPIAVIDTRWMIIPNTIILTGLMTGLAIITLMAILKQDINYLLKHILWASTGGMTIQTIAIVGRFVFRKESMGFGDTKLMFLIGLFLGRWQSILTVLTMAAFTGSIIGLILIIFRSKQPNSEIPFAPFLTIAATLDFIWHNQIWTTYLRLIGW